MLQLTELLLDLDGVLIGSGEEMFPALKECLEWLRGRRVKVRVVSSRPYALAVTAIQFYQLNLDIPHIFDAGSLIRSEHEILYFLPLPDEAIEQLLECYSGDLSDAAIQASTKDSLLMNEKCRERLKGFPMSPIVGKLDMIPKEYLTIGLRGIDSVKAQYIKTTFEKFCQVDSFLRSNGSYTIFLRHKESSKLNALRQLEKKQVLNLLNAMVISDDDLDSEIFAHAGIGAAPSNAQPLALARADMVSRLPAGLGCQDLISRIWPTLKL